MHYAMPSPDTVLPIPTLLSDLGLSSPDAQAQGRALLEQHGLTRAGKQNLAIGKVERARAVIVGHLRRVCNNSDCTRLAAAQWPEKASVLVEPAHCDICGGSSQRRAARLLAEALQWVGISRLLLLGGTPPQHTTLRDFLADAPLELRLIDGSARAHSAAEAAQQLAWAQLLVIWASTPLHHKVSVAYTSQAPPGLLVITVTRRGIESLCRGVAEQVGRRRG